MSHRENWLEKQFNFYFPASQYVEFIQFLQETPAKIEALIENLPREVLIQRDQAQRIKCL